jgi:radical SAM protein with 4Fe4S-binding SPASM domain
MEISLHEKIIKDLKKIGFRGQILYQFYCEPLTDIRLESHILFARKCLPANHIAVYTNGDLLTRKRMDSLFAAGLSKIYVTLHEKKNTEGFRKMYSALTSRQKSRIEIRELDADSLLATRGGLVTVRNRETRSFCGYPSNTLSIDAYGNVVLCCEDYLGKHKFGNLKNRGLRQIWDDEGFRKIRDDTKKGKFILPICKHCTEN